MDKLRLKIEKFAKVHTIPPVLAVLLKELENNKSTSESIAAIVNKDISLTARLLRAANSAFYKRQFEISTIEMAVSVLGTKAVRALALSVSLFDITSNERISKLFDLKEFWRHNLETAIISQKLAEESKCCQPEEAFVCGLLHDLGLLFLIQECRDEYIGVLDINNSENSIEEIEKEVIGTTHSEVGAIIASVWRLPGSICESIANHHQTELPPIAGSAKEIWHIVNLAHRFCRNGIDVNTDLSVEILELRQSMVDDMGLNQGEISKHLADVPEQVLQAASYMDIDIGDPITLLQKANIELGNLYEQYEKSRVYNYHLQKKQLEQEKNKVALEALKTTMATLSHYVNNANAAIIGRAQILDLYLKQGRLDDPEDKLAESIRVISESVDVISAVLDELKDFPEYKTIKYHGHSKILDIDNKIKARLGRLA